MLLVIIVVFMIASWAVSTRLKNKFKKYSQVTLGSGLSGREIAELMLRDNGIYDVSVTSVQGKLTDHYNPANKTVNLSPDVYNGRSAAAAAVAAHECGHAVQHAKAYRWLEFRSAMVPVQNVSAKVINFVFIAMFIGAFGLNMLNTTTALLVIIACYSVFTLFAFVTLPVEYDASNRALAWIKDRNIVDDREHRMAKDALNAAASTYLVAALGALATLLYYVMLFLGNRD
ncbi:MULTISPECIES: zinc metallopeptidase [unclassified Ekhidna]|jgi:Zn-dependent membrane protease YugP|uniref:zinc metallopeptidase n=1 Tax=unclassified Ekhidna TaxID=2632188 RepID=UPI0032DE504C